MKVYAAVKELGSQAYSFPVGTHGFPLPNIKTWNNAIKAMQQDMGEGWIINGAIDDLVSAECPSCHGELMRISRPFNEVFRVATIQCQNSYSREHPHEYWVEVWPDANWPRDYYPYLNPDAPGHLVNRFRLSDPRIKTSFTRDTILGHFTEKGVRFPEPDFVHK